MAPDIFSEWLAALEARHLADLRVPEVTRALRALSSAYVERRQALARGAALDSHGKRAAFALFYAPLHFMIVRHVVIALGAHQPAPSTVVDLGCGTGAAGAAWALAAGEDTAGRFGVGSESVRSGFGVGSESVQSGFGVGSESVRSGFGVGSESVRSTPKVLGLDRHPWAVEETRWTYARLGLEGQARQADITRFRPPRGHVAIAAAYVLNEMPEAAREPLVRTLLDAAAAGARLLILEPISRAVTPWWEDVAARAREIGGRTDEWRIPLDLPPLLALFDKAAGLNHKEVKARSLFVGRSA